MKVIVVGAGPAGLAVGLGLVARGVEVTVLEAAAFAGGRVRTLHEGAYRVELGPAGILDDVPETQAVIAALGSDAPKIVHASELVKRRYIVRDGRPRAVPTSPPALLFGSSLSLREKLSLLREPFAPPAAGPSPESVADFVRRRLGPQLAEAFAQPMVAGVFGGDYEALEMASAFPRLWALPLLHGNLLMGLTAQARARRQAGAARPRLMSFAGGMGALPTAMATRLGERLRLGVAVQALEPADLGAPRVRLADGSVHVADHLVLALPPEESARLLGWEPALGADLTRIPSVPIASVTLAYRRADVAHALDGFGLLCPRREGYRTLGVLFMTSIFPDAGLAPMGQVLLRVLLGGVNDPHIDALDDTALVETAARELGALLGARDPRYSHLQRWPRAIAQYTLGHGDRAIEIERRAAAHGLSITGTALHGVGVNDVLRDAARLVDRICPPR